MTALPYTRKIPERVIEGKRLGRHVSRDPRSLLYLAGAAPVINSKSYTALVDVFDQGNLGSCTGNATVGELCFDPFYSTLSPATRAKLNEKLAVDVYSLATQLDDVSGTYPPDDTGSDGPSAAKAAFQMGLASGYQHAVDLSGILSMLQSAPCAIGVNWYDSFDEPASDGTITIKPGATVRGGHELCACAVDTVAKMVKLRNSWGPGWGKSGYCWIGYSDLTRLMNEDGDATQLVALTAPAPTPTPVPVSQAVQTWYAQSKTWMHGRHVGQNKLAAESALALAKAEGLE